jgi:hypothetical protein
MSPLGDMLRIAGLSEGTSEFYAFMRALTEHEDDLVHRAADIQRRHIQMFFPDAPGWGKVIPDLIDPYVK